MPEYYSIGDENEADYVAQQSQIIWKETEGAIEWLKKHTQFMPMVTHNVEWKFTDAKTVPQQIR